MIEASLLSNELSDHSEIRLMLEDYDDIFSDFDPRPYAEKALSVDFLEELKRASIDKGLGNIYIRLIIPKKKKSESSEHIIKRRLHEHFKKHHNILHKEINSVIQRGVSFAVVGIILMFIAAYILFKNNQTLIISFLIILFEPAGWFLFWEGLNQAIFESKNKKPDESFYHKMAKSEIDFVSY